MRYLLVLVLLIIILSGCARKYGEADGRLVCTKSGLAFLIKPHVGDTSFVLRVPDADAECRAWRNEPPAKSERKVLS